MCRVCTGAQRDPAEWILAAGWNFPCSNEGNGAYISNGALVPLLLMCSLRYFFGGRWTLARRGTSKSDWRL